jgi:hypothetical protein
MSILAIAAAATLAAPAAGKEPDFRIPTKREIARCEKLQGIDWKKVRKQALADARTGAPYDPLDEHRRIRGPRPLPDLGAAEIVFDVSIGPGKTQEYPTSTSSFVWREKGGAWQLSRVDHTTFPPEPLPPDSGVVMDRAWNELAMRPVTEGPLSTDQAKALDRILADPCFAAQPDMVPFAVPRKKGPPEPCWGVINTGVRMRAGGRDRFLSDPCGRGYGFDLARIVMYGTIDTGVVIQRALAVRLKRDDVVITEAKLGKSGSIAQMVCGTVAAPGLEPLRFTWKRWMQGPYPKDTLVLAGEIDPSTGEAFAAQWERRCSA